MTLTMCRTAVVMLALTFDTGIANAQALPPLELTINDENPLSGFPTSMKPEVLGLEIGMTFDAARVAMEASGLQMLEDAPELNNADQFAPKRVGYEFREMDLAPIYAWDDGFNLEIAPVRASLGLSMFHEVLTVDAARDVVFGGEFLWASMGSPSVGGRVQEVHRVQKFETPVELTSLQARLIEKYGQPSLDDAGYGSWHTMAWHFKNGRQAMPSDPNGFSLGQNCNPSAYSVSTGIMFEDGKVGGWLGGPIDPRTTDDHCDAFIVARLATGKVPGTTTGLNLYVVDSLAVWANAESIGAQAEAAHRTWLEGNAGSTEVPDL